MLAEDTVGAEACSWRSARRVNLATAPAFPVLMGNAR